MFWNSKWRYVKKANSKPPRRSGGFRWQSSLQFEFLEIRALLNSAPVGYIPSQIRHAYGIDQIDFLGGAIEGDGTGQTIAIIDAYDSPTAEADLAAFSEYFDLPDPPSFTRVAQDGTTNYPGTDPAGPGTLNWELETALDLQWAHAMAPGASILLVEANNASSANLYAAVDYARQQANVSVISMSFGSDEFSTEKFSDPHFTTPSGHEGITFIASTGDTGQPGSYPAYSKNVLAVGGTTLSLSGSNYSSESGWSGSGGGISQYESQPAFQSGVVTQSSTKRTIPDVSFVGGSGVAVYDSYNYPAEDSHWSPNGIGGTSLSAPCWAGLIAIVDQGRELGNLSLLSSSSTSTIFGTMPKIYASPSSNFHDITSGNNGFAAGAGYDLVTGRGTPIANLLLPDLSGRLSYTAPASAALTLKIVGSNVQILNSSNVVVAQRPVADTSEIIITGSSNNTLTIDSTNGFPAPPGGLTFTGGTGTNSLTVNDQATSASTAYSITNSTVSRGSTDIRYSGLSSLTVNGGSGGNTFNVTSTASGTTTSVNSANSNHTNTYNISGTSSNLTVYGGGGTSTDYLNLTGTGPGTTTTLYGESNNVTFSVGANYGTSGNLSSIAGNVLINGYGSGTNGLVVHDEQNSTFITTFTITGTTLSRTSGPTITYSNLATLDLNTNSNINIINITNTASGTVTTLWGGTGIEIFNIYGTSSDVIVHGSDYVDVFNVMATGSGTTTTLDGNAGTDFFTIGSPGYATAGTLNSVLGNITIDGGTNNDSLYIRDDNNTTGRTYSVNGTTVSRSSGPTITYSNIPTLALYAGSGTNTMNVTGTASGTTTNVYGGSGTDTITVSAALSAVNIYAGGGNDAVTVSNSGTLDNIGGTVTVDGGTGTDTLDVDDDSDANTNTYNWSSSSIVRTAVGTVTVNFSNIDATTLEVNGSSTINHI